MRKFLLTITFSLSFLLIFLVPKTSAAFTCQISSILPTGATSNDDLKVTITDIQSGLYYTLNIVNLSESLGGGITSGNNGTPVVINKYSGETTSPSSSIEFPVGTLSPGNYMFIINGRQTQNIRGNSVDYCYNKNAVGFQVLTPIGTTPTINQMGWDHDVEKNKCVQKIGGRWNTERECIVQYVPYDVNVNPYCLTLETPPSTLFNCSKNAEKSEKKYCLTSGPSDSPDFSSSRLGFVCGNPEQQIFCVKEGVDPANATIQDVQCEEPSTPRAPCSKWGAWNGTEYVPIEEKNLGEYFDEKKGYVKPDKKVSCLTLSTAIGGIDIKPQELVKSVFNVVLGLAGGIALILIIISGYRFMTSGGNPEKTKAATEQLTSAIIGLLFIIFSFVLLQIVGVDILRIPGFTP